MNFDDLNPRGREPNKDTGSGFPVKPKYFVWGALGVLALIAGNGCYYTVNPNEVAGVRLMGKVESTQPVTSGLHFKLPWVESVEYLQTSLNKFGVKDLNVYTVDNQPITISVSMTYDIPASKAFYLMYGVGKTGNFDIWANVEPVIADRAMRVFSQENTVSISEDRTKLDAAIEQSVRDAVNTMFGIRVRDLQITSIVYSPSFETSINAAVTAKNRAIQAENQVNQVRYEADQAKIEAEGKANAAVAAAQGANRATILQAEAQAQATLLNAKSEAQARQMVGEAQAKAIQAIGEAVAANPQVVNYEMTQKWGGTVPQTVISGDKGALPLLNLTPPTR